MESILISCVVGIAAGWLASLVMKGGGSGLLRDLIIGLAGGFIGHWLIPKTGLILPGGYPGMVLSAFGGAVVLLLVIRMLAK